MSSIWKAHKGQITLVNMIALVITLILYLAFIPVIQPMIDSTALALDATPNEYTGLVKSLMYMIPFFFMVSIVVTAFNYAIPRREGY